MATPPDQNLAIDRWPEVSERVGYRSLSHVEKLESEGRFPKSVKLGARAKGWVRSEVTQWIQDRIEKSRGESS
jgi:prophage regulatory protein